jgi:hypothetical protein
MAMFTTSNKAATAEGTTTAKKTGKIKKQRKQEIGCHRRKSLVFANPSVGDDKNMVS